MHFGLESNSQFTHMVRKPTMQPMSMDNWTLFSRQIWINNKETSRLQSKKQYGHLTFPTAQGVVSSGWCVSSTTPWWWGCWVWGRSSWRTTPWWNRRSDGYPDRIGNEKRQTVFHTVHLNILFGHFGNQLGREKRFCFLKSISSRFKTKVKDIQWSQIFCE